MTPEEHASTCAGRHTLNDRAPDGSWSTTCVRCGYSVGGYPNGYLADRAFWDEAPPSVTAVGSPGRDKTTQEAT